jgi:hypothetical protein
VTLRSGEASTRFLPPFRLRKGYAWATAILLVVEILIALFVRDGFVRPHLGDALAVALVYCALSAALDLRPLHAAAFAFAVAAAIEFGQYLQVLRMVGLERNVVARTVLGSGFDPLDFLAYLTGAIGVLAIETARRRAEA